MSPPKYGATSKYGARGNMAPAPTMDDLREEVALLGQEINELLGEMAQPCPHCGKFRNHKGG